MLKYIAHYFLVFVRVHIGLLLCTIASLGLSGTSLTDTVLGSSLQTLTIISGLEQYSFLFILMSGFLMFMPTRLIIKLDKVKLYHWVLFCGYVPYVMCLVYKTLYIEYPGSLLGIPISGLYISFLLIGGLIIYTINHFSIETRLAINKIKATPIKVD